MQLQDFNTDIIARNCIILPFMDRFPTVHHHCLLWLMQTLTHDTLRTLSPRLLYLGHKEGDINGRLLHAKVILISYDLGNSTIHWTLAPIPTIFQGKWPYTWWCFEYIKALAPSTVALDYAIIIINAYKNS